MGNKKSWTVADMPDQRDRVAVVTGANSGLGYEDAMALAANGAQVVMACRNQEKGAAAATAIRGRHPAAQVDVMALDLADLASVRAFAAAFAANYARLDLLINNAGVMALPYRTTADGFEMQFGTNHLGHFALTGLLLEPLLTTPDARVVTVSSILHKSGVINFEDLQSTKAYDKQKAYAQSKLANLLFAYELQRRLEAMGANLISVAAHPGYSATNLQTAGLEMDGSRVSKLIMSVMNATVAQSQAKGALPTLYAATAPDVMGGDYYGPDGFMELRGEPVKVDSTSLSHDPVAAARLWAISQELTGVPFAQLESMPA